MPCGRDTCADCQNFINDKLIFKCRLSYDISDMLVMNTDDNDDFKKR